VVEISHKQWESNGKYENIWKSMWKMGSQWEVVDIKYETNGKSLINGIFNGKM
jgi:hypothetical protein